MFRKNTLSFRIISQLLVITLTLFLLILSGYYYYTKVIIRNNAREYAIEMAGNLAGKITGELEPLEKIPELVAASLELDLVSPDAIFTLLTAILEKNNNVYGTSIAFEPNYFNEQERYFMPYAYRIDGGISNVMLGAPDYEYFYMDWYQIPKMLGEAYWSEPYYDEGGGNVLMTTYSVPFHTISDSLREFVGVVTIDIELERLTGFVSEVQIFESGYAFMVSRNGVAITHPDKSQIMNSSIFSIAEEWDAPILREIGRDLMSGNSDFREYNVRGRKQWIYYTNLGSNNWSIGVVYPDEEMFAALKQMNLLTIILVVAGLFLLALVIVKIVNNLTAPLSLFARSTKKIAEGNFDTELPAVKTNDEMLELKNAFDNMQQQLKKYIRDLADTITAKEKIESELRIARDIQMSMIPHTFPPFPDLPQVNLYAMLKSAKEVGGDLYDFFLIDKNRFCFAIGDVSGKGIPASLFMAVTRTLLRSIADKFHQPVEIVNILNKSLALNNDSCMFVTFFLGILDLNSGAIKYVNAGHNPPVLIRANGSIEMVKVENSIPLGLYEDYQYVEQELVLNSNEKIFLYTDGVNEAENEQKVLFGDEKLLEIITENHQADTKSLIHTVEHAIGKHSDGYEQSDDITMMTVSFNTTNQA